MSGARHYNCAYQGPRNRRAVKRAQRYECQIRELMLAHVKRNPLARQLTAKEIHATLREIEPRTISWYMQIIRNKAEAELMERGCVASE